MMLSARVGEEMAQYTPPPRAALPLVMVKPSSTEAAVSPDWNFTTLPLWSPSMIVVATTSG